MALNKTYWDYDNAQSVDWATYGVKYANKQIYANPNFSWGNLDYSFPTSFRKRNITRLKHTGNGQSQACETIPDCLIYNSMIAYSGNGATGSFYKDNYYSYYSAGNEGYFPVIDIDTHDFAYKMTVALFSSGNWITVNAVDFVNNYDSYAANVYGYINNYIESPGSRYTFCNYYVTEDSQFSVHANMYGFRTSGYGSVNLGGHAVSGQTAWYNRSIWQLCATTAGNYSNLSYPANSYFPFEIPELNGESWNAGSEVAPDALMTGGIYTNHAVLTYNDQRVYMPLKHILRDIIVNSGLVLLDSNDDKWISMVDANGLCQDKLVLLSSDEAKESSIYNTRTSDNNLNPSPTPPGPGGDDPWHGVNFGGTGAGGGGAFCSVYYMTGAQLASLKNWSNTSAPEGFDMLPSIIGLQQLPVAVSGVATTVKFLKSAAITPSGESRLVDTGVAAGTGTGQPIPFSLGSVDINRRMQQRGEPYMDYDCTVELFLPFAGTFVLDTQAVMGRTISAEIVVDPVNGTAFAYAWVENGGEKMPIAYGGGAIAVDLPIASNQWGISRAAFKQQRANAVINAVKDVGNFIIGAQTHKTGSSGAIVDRSGFATLNIQEGLQAKQIGGQMMISSTINAATNTASSIISATQLNNTNYTAINGSFGGSYAEWSQPFTAYVRITRPKFKKPDNFNHTEAVPCVETKKIKDCTGLTICVNPDCGSISCTEAEKLMIAQALVGGVYAGGGS